MRGFTLLEIMIVVALIALLATLVGPHVLKDWEDGAKRIALTKCREYHDAVVSYRLFDKRHRWPDSLQDVKEARGLHLDPDPWGGDYTLRIEGETVRVHCAGPDGTEGTDDDIVYVPEDD